MTFVDSLNIGTNITRMIDTRNWFETLPPTRQRKLLSSQRNGLNIEVGGQSLVNFASNDYLGLSQHPDVCSAAKDAVDTFGLGSGASRLVSGDSPLFHAFERNLADWKGFEACLLVGSGMLANLGLLQSLADRHTVIFADKLNHASLVDGARLSGAKVHRYPHLNLRILAQQLQQYPAKNRIIVSDGVFSMDGDTADVVSLLRLAEEYDTLVVIDDAHGAGTVGAGGKGLVNQANMMGHARLIEVGTLGKSFGSYGAYILGTASMIEGLKQRMRTLIYTTALPVAVLVAAQAALDIIKQGEVVHVLQGHIAYFLSQTKALNLLPSHTPIQPMILGSDEQALAASALLKECGFFVPAIRPPTVPEGQARLRITLSALHNRQQIDALVKVLLNRA